MIYKTDMELKTAIEILEYHQEWRQGKRDDMIHEPKKLTEALDIVLREVKKSLIQNISYCVCCEKKPKHKDSFHCIDCLYNRKMNGFIDK